MGFGRQRAREGKPQGGKRRLEKGKRKEQRVEREEGGREGWRFLSWGCEAEASRGEEDLDVHQGEDFST